MLARTAELCFATVCTAFSGISAYPGDHRHQLTDLPDPESGLSSQLSAPTLQYLAGHSELGREQAIPADKRISLPIPGSGWTTDAGEPGQQGLAHDAQG